VRRHHLTALSAFALVFVTWQMARSTHRSATWDEPVHLTAGYAALTARDFRMDFSHPPLSRAWAAIPLAMAGRPPADLSIIDRTSPGDWVPRAYDFARRFVFADAGGDGMLQTARAMMVVWGLLLGVLVYAWANEWLGARGALVALTLYTLEPNLGAHGTLVTTDFAVTTLTFGAVYFLWRMCQRTNRLDLAGLAVCVALAAVAKFSTLILIPIGGTLLAVAVARRRLTVRQASFAVAATTATTVLAIWAAYGFRYAPSSDPRWLFPPTSGGVGVPGMAPLLNWMDRLHLVPNAFAQGVLFSFSSARALPAFLAGEVKTGGWWYYFPVAVALKTPDAMLALATIGVAACASRRAGLTLTFLLAPVAIWMTAAAASGVNLGVRHVLPIFPFLVLLAAAGASMLLARGGLRRTLAVAAMLTIAIEVGRSEPYPLSFFNTLAGGPAHGGRYLADSNLAWGGSLKALRRWMDRHDIETVNLAYFGSVDPAAYGVRAIYLPSSATFLGDRLGKPQLPGYVAISGTTLDGVYLPRWWRRFYSGFRDREPAAVIANSMRVYWVNRWPDVETASLDADALHTLADGLLFGMHWPERAVGRYRAVLDREPRDADAWNGLSLALAQTGRTAEALEGFRRVLALAPDDPDVRRNISLLDQQLRQVRSKRWP